MSWRDEPMTEKQKKCILEMQEYSEYSLPPFKGLTKGEASDYINENIAWVYTSLWALENGYD